LKTKDEAIDRLTVAVEGLVETNRALVERIDRIAPAAPSKAERRTALLSGIPYTEAELRALSRQQMVMLGAALSLPRLELTRGPDVLVPAILRVQRAACY